MVKRRLPSLLGLREYWRHSAFSGGLTGIASVAAATVAVGAVCAVIALVVTLVF